MPTIEELRKSLICGVINKDTNRDSFKTIKFSLYGQLKNTNEIIDLPNEVIEFLRQEINSNKFIVFDRTSYLNFLEKRIRNNKIKPYLKAELIHKFNELKIEIAGYDNVVKCNESIIEHSSSSLRQ